MKILLHYYRKTRFSWFRGEPQFLAQVQSSYTVESTASRNCSATLPSGRLIQILVPFLRANAELQYREKIVGNRHELGPMAFEAG